MFKLVDVSVNFRGVRYDREALVYEPLERVLDYPYAWACAKYAEPSSHSERLRVMRRFLIYLATRPLNPFDEKGLLNFWLYVTAGDIQAWKQHRVDERLVTGKGADWKTIDNEGDAICYFLIWLGEEANVRLLYKPKTKIESAESLSRHSRRRSRHGTRVLDKGETNISKPDATGLEDELEEEDYTSGLTLPNETKYLRTEQLIALEKSFSDIVYTCICAAAHHTGLRNFEMLGIPPSIPGGNLKTFTCDPRLLLEKLEKSHEKNPEMILPVRGKFSVHRDIPIDVRTWLKIMENWWPVYQERRRKYKKKFGEDPPNGCIWISSRLLPLFCHRDKKSTHRKPLQAMRNAFKYVSRTKKEGSLAEDHGFSAHYYKLRYTFATEYVFELMSRHPEHDREWWISDMTHKGRLAARMGHKSLSTTFEHYVDSAIFMRAQIEGGDSATTWFPNQAKYLDRVFSRRNKKDESIDS